MFVGIETPEADALMHMRKEHNAALPMLDAIHTLNSYGLEVTSGIILGLDTDTADTEARLKAFIDASQIPILTINLLQALPKTPLWDRLKRAGRIVADDTSRESNVQFLRPYDEVVAMWRRCIAHAYAPERLFERFTHQIGRDLRQPAGRAGPRQAHREQSPPGAGAGVQRRLADRCFFRLSPLVLEGGACRRFAAARSTPR